MGGQLRRIFAIKSNRMMAAICGGLTVFFLVGGIGLVAFGGYPSLLLITVVGFAIIAPLLLAGIVVPMSRAYLADIDHMLAGQSWAHWTYDAAGWSVALGAKQGGPGSG